MCLKWFECQISHLRSKRSSVSLRTYAISCFQVIPRQSVRPYSMKRGRNALGEVKEGLGLLIDGVKESESLFIDEATLDLALHDQTSPNTAYHIFGST